MKKNYLLTGFILAMLMISAGLSAQFYSGGSGTSGDPFQIATKADLKYLSENSVEWSKHFKQTADIAFETADFESGGDFYNGGAGFITIGNLTTNFTSSYDGNGHTISNLFLDRVSSDNISMFGYTSVGATIKNLGLVANDITGNRYVGGLVGYNSGSIENCYTTGPVIAYNQDVGGIAGFNDGSITNSHAQGDISASGHPTDCQTAGGLVGDHRGTIDNCYATGNVSVSTSSNTTGFEVGGLVGYTADTDGISITNSYATGSVSGIEEVGGFIGDNKCHVSGCYSTGNVYCYPISTDYWRAEGGGFVGVNYGNIDNCYTFSDVVRVTDGRGNSYGGFVGRQASGSIEKSYCANTVTASTGTAIDGLRAFSGYGMTQNDATTGNFADQTVTNQTSVYGAVFKTTDEMKTENFDGWDWTDTWERIGYNYPRLKDNPDPALPVTLSSFTVSCINSTATLTWITQSESNNLGWNVYRSDVAELETAILINNQLIPGAGTSSEPTSYSYNDESDLISETTYWYWLESISIGGDNQIHPPVSLFVPLDSDEPDLPFIPEFYGLYQNYPNPFNPVTTISFCLEEDADVHLIIYDIKGRLVTTIYSGVITGKSLQTFIWNGEDEYGEEVASGMYLYSLKVGNKTSTRKMILLR